MDDEWCTVGSSNLDPMSLLFNLEANVIIRDHDFTQVLSANLDKLMCHACNEITTAPPRSARITGAGRARDRAGPRRRAP